MDRRSLLLVGLGTSLTAPAVRAQDKYPSRPIRLVIPFPPGGPTDLMGRRYGEKLSALLGQPVVIDDKAGAGGVLGADLVAKSRPDGYTLLLGSSSTQVTGPLLMPNAPYDPVKDFTLFIIGFVPMVISCNTSVPAKTLPEFVALLNANPDKYRHSSSGMGSIGHLGAELFKLKAGRLVSLHVPYKGNNPAVQAALTGEVDWLLDTIGTTLGHHHAGKMRYLAVCAEKRTSVVPELPTTSECGLPDVLVSTVNPVALPARAPAEVVNRIAEARAASCRTKSCRPICARFPSSRSPMPIRRNPPPISAPSGTAGRRSSRRAARRWSEVLGVEHRPLRIGIIEHRPAAGETGALVDRPGSRMAIARFQHELPEAFATRQDFDLGHDHGTDLAAAMRRPGVHAFDLADAVGMPLQRAARHGLAVLPGDEHRRIGLRHLLGGHVECELGRRQLEQGRIELGNQGPHVVLQRAFDGNREAAHGSVPISSDRAC